MTAVSRAAQDPVRADDPGAVESEENGPEENGAATPPLFDNYLAPERPHAGAWDEMFSPDGSVRAHRRARAGAGCRATSRRLRGLCRVR